MSRRKHRKSPPPPASGGLNVAPYGPAPASPRRIFIAVPTYSGQIDYSCHLSICRFMGEAGARGWMIESMFRTMDSVISRARNVLFSAFLQTDCTDMFFLDADIGCRPGSITRLMDHPVDVVGGPYRGRSDTQMDYCLRTLDSGIMQFDPDTRLMEVDAVATGFLRISRNAAEKMAEAHKDDWYEDSTAPAGLKVLNVFDFKFIDHRYWSEDYTFCRRWRELGGKVWVDPMVELDHTGTKVFRGCLFDALTQAKQQEGTAVMPTTVELARAFINAADRSATREAAA
jgi:hypothetical protein